MIQPKHFLIACGGTGGHLSPGIAVAQELTARGHRCKLLISEKRVDQALCSAYPELAFIPLSGVGFSKKLSNLPRCFLAAFKNILQSFRLLRNTKADAVIGFGGFTNVGIVLAAKFLRKPCFLHEANRIPGRAVRVLGRWATVVYVPEIFQNQQHLRMKVCGFPIRREFQKVDKAVAKQQLGFDPKKLLLVVVGGSQGARVLTQWAREHIEDFKRHDIQLLCLTGVRNGGENTEVTASFASDLSFRFIPFCHQMHIVYSAADVVIGRAGAGTIAELTVCETPSILVPFPTSADGHQRANARAFEQQGGCVCLEQSDLTKLWEKALELFSDKEKRFEMSERLRTLNTIDATRMMVTDIERMLGTV